KKITWRDGWRALAAILWAGLWDRRFTHHDGYYILTSVRNAGRFNRWMFRTLERFVGQNVLEAGCGIGNMTELLLQRSRVVGVDIDPLFTHFMEQRFGDLENFRVLQADLAHVEEIPAFSEAAFDTILCVNVLEHIEDDAGVLVQFQHLLQ